MPRSCSARRTAEPGAAQRGRTPGPTIASTTPPSTGAEATSAGRVRGPRCGGPRCDTPGNRLGDRHEPGLVADPQQGAEPGHDRADPPDRDRQGDACRRGEPAEQEAADRRRAREDGRVEAHRATPERVRDVELDHRVGGRRHRDAPEPDDHHQQDRHREQVRDREQDLGKPEGDRATDHPAHAGQAARHRQPRRRDQRADARRSHQEAVAGRIGAEDVARERRDDDREVHPERADQADDDDGEEYGRGVPHVGDPFAELLDDLWGGPRSWRQLWRPKGGGVHGRERDEHRREARGVDGKRGAGAERPDRQAGNGRADDARRIEHRRVEGDRVSDVAAPDDLDHEALADGHVDRIGGAEEQCQDDDHPDLDDAGQREHGEDRGENHHHRLHDEDRLAFRQCVREDAAEQPEDHHRDELGGGDHAEPQRIVGELENQPGLGNLLHPGPDQRDELAAEEQLVVAVAEGAQPPDGVNRHRRRPALVALGERSMPARWSARWRRRASASSIISAIRSALWRSVSI